MFGRKNPAGNRRGVALLIVLMITALLIALIFEFAYASRISLNSAVNFRDSQRAYFIARSGVFVFMKFNNKMGDLKKLIPEGQWQTVPIVSQGDTQLNVKWDDEAGKIMITDVKTNPYTQAFVKNLFELKGVDADVYDRLVDHTSTVDRIGVLSGLHAYMSDEEYNKVSPALTTTPVNQQNSKYININTASADVLEALGVSRDAAQLIIENRDPQKPYTVTAMPDSVKQAMVPGLQSMAAVNFLADQSNYFKVYAYATVGGYTKQIEAIVNLGNNQILYWRAL